MAALPPRREDLPDSGPAGLADLRDEPWIAPHSDTALRTVLERACQQAEFEPGLDYTSDDETVIMSLVQQASASPWSPGSSPNRSPRMCGCARWPGCA